MVMDGNVENLVQEVNIFGAGFVHLLYLKNLYREEAVKEVE